MGAARGENDGNHWKKLKKMGNKPYNCGYSSLLWVIKHGDMNGDNGEGITQFFSGGMPWGRFCQDDPVWVILELFL